MVVVFCFVVAVSIFFGCFGGGLVLFFSQKALKLTEIFVSQVLGLTVYTTAPSPKLFVLFCLQDRVSLCSPDCLELPL